MNFQSDFKVAYLCIYIVVINAKIGIFTPLCKYIIMDVLQALFNEAWFKKDNTKYMESMSKSMFFWPKTRIKKMNYG